MLAGHIEKSTHTIGGNGYNSLPVRAETVHFEDGMRAPALRSAWIPTPKELRALNAGASIHVLLLCTQHPPIHMSIGEPVEPVEANTSGNELQEIIERQAEMIRRQNERIIQYQDELHALRAELEKLKQK